VSSKNLIIGTAGHIDHGKTTLVKALTNIDCDRLKEEKERGITIELGFAYFDLPSGRRAGIVDVPGHERFIKNMLAGAGGMDLVMLVVAADEGVMPQTVEHLHILSLLQVKRGMVVVTKADLVEEEWLELVLMDIRDRIADTFLEEAPIIPVSAVTGEGMDVLTATMDNLMDDVAAKNANLPFRLPIDRVFTVQGFGTVVTGTLCAGAVAVGDLVEVMPSQLSGRVRGVGVHGKQVGRAEAGQRTAINLAGLTVEQISRGDMLCAPGVLRPSMMLDVRLSLLKDVDKALINRERVRFYSGTSEVLGRVILLDAEALLPGEEAFVQLRLEEPVALWAGDRFVLRSYSPMVTIGGGAILDPHPVKRKRFREQGLSELRVLESGSATAILDQYLRKHSNQTLTREKLLALISRPGPELDEALEELLAAEYAVSLRADDSSYIFHRDYLKSLAEKLESLVTEYHRRYPLRRGIPREEIRSRLLPQAGTRVFGAILLELQADAPVVVGSRVVASQGFEVSFSGKWAKAHETLTQKFESQLFAPPTLDDAPELVRLTPDDTRELLDALVEQEMLVKVAEGMYFHRLAVCKALDLLTAHCSANGNAEFTLADFRTVIDSSRKYALPLLEYMDQRKITLRSGEARRLNSSFDRSALQC
jgi:selenocysteine-specific elongation factor